jgi:DNA topoisomerase VI subunit B
MNKIEFQNPSDSTAMDRFVSVDDIRKEIKKLEQEVEHKLTTYSNLSERIQQEIQDSLDNELAFSNSELSDELKFLLNKVILVLRKTVNKLQLSELNKQLTQTNANTSIVQHHRSRYEDYTKEYRRLMVNHNQ